MTRLVSPSFVLLSLAMSCPTALAESQDNSVSPRVALIDGIRFTVEGIPKTVHERERFFSVFRKALDHDGWPTVDPVSDDACNGVADCLPATATLAKAGYALRLTGEGNLKLGYTIHLELYSAASSRKEQTTAFCDICNTDRMAGIAADFASKLLAAAAKGAPSSAVSPSLSGSITPAPQASKDIVTPPAPGPSTRPLWFPGAMTALGVVGMAYGTWALVKNGDSTGSPYSSSPTSYAHDTYSSTGVGIGALIGGGVLVAAGIVWLVTIQTKSTTISAAPSRVAVTVRF